MSLCLLVHFDLNAVDFGRAADIVCICIALYQVLYEALTETLKSLNERIVCAPELHTKSLKTL